MSAKPGKRKNGASSFMSLGSGPETIASIGRLLDRDHAFQDIGPRRAFPAGKVAQGRLGMRPGVRCDRMSVQNLAPGEIGQRRRVAADLEEGGFHAFGLERVEDFRRVHGVRTVVEGEDHLVVGERNRPG